MISHGYYDIDEETKKLKLLKFKFRKYQMAYCDFTDTFVNINSILVLLRRHDTIQLVKYCKQNSIDYKELV